MGNNQIIRKVVDCDKHNYLQIERSYRALYFKYESCLELESIYYLINYSNLFSKATMKFLLKIGFIWLDFNIDVLKKNTYVISQDFSGASALIVSLSEIYNIKVVGLQHGLMSYTHLKNGYIYPNIRTKLELAYNQKYASLLTKNKKNGIAINFGPLISRNKVEKSKFNIKKVYFISSMDLSDLEKIKIIVKIENYLKSKKIKLIVRPHPQEMKNIYNGVIDTSDVNLIYTNKIDECLFIGYYSTLLYNLGYMGYKTIWINNLNIETTEDIKISNELVNSYIVKDYLIEEELNNFIGQEMNDQGSRNAADELKIFFDKLRNNE